jgi:putative transposase
MNSNKILEEWQETLINQPDFLKQILQNLMQLTLKEEFTKFIGAENYERTDQRKGYRNGTYERSLKTRVGKLDLNVCRDRNGEFQTELFERYQRSEKALILGILEMYLHGVATRKMEGILETLCGYGISKSQVSSMSHYLDKDLKNWRERSLEKYRYVFFDARYEKIRENGHVISNAAVVAVGTTEEGFREIIGCDVINSESFEDWDEFIGSLRARGLIGVEYTVSDDNKGLRKAIEKHFQGALWQRCQVHFMRNFISKISKAEAPEAIRLLQEVFASFSKEEAKEKLPKLEAFLKEKKKFSLWDWLEDNIEDTFTVFALPIEHQKKMKSTNMLERYNQELKRRSQVIRIFPNAASCLRLVTALCQEKSEEWGNKRYLRNEEKEKKIDPSPSLRRAI